MPKWKPRVRLIEADTSRFVIDMELGRVMVETDSTGLAEHRRGEWRVLCRMNRLSRRQLRKAHLAVEARAEDRVIYTWRLTASRRRDGPLLPELLERIQGPIGDVLGDGA
jgi:hypothetical protein